MLCALETPPADAQSAGAETSSLFSPNPDIDARSGRFRRIDPSQRLDGRSRFGDLQIAAQPASGAGTTGFDSTNARRRVRAARPRAGRAGQPRPAAVQTVPMRPTPQAGRRSGASETTPVPVPIIATPSRRRAPPAQDPYDPLGLRLGSFTLWPAIELTGGYDTNPSRGTPVRGSALVTAAPELRLASDWQRHALTAEVRGTYTGYSEKFACCNPDGTLAGTTNSLNRPTLDSKVNGRLDISSQDRLEGEGRVVVGTDNPGSPNIPVGLERLPIYTMYGGTLGYVHAFNRLEISARGAVDRRVYEQSLFTDGSRFDNDDRNYNQYAGALRGSYDALPGVRPFVEVGADTRLHDIDVDRSGARRDSVGQVVRAGSTFEISRKLSGEFSAGYMSRRYKDPALDGIGGFVFDSSLVWRASALTTLRMIGQSTIDEIVVPGVSGVMRRDFGLQADHAFRRWLIGTVRFGYGIDDYVGMERHDQRFFTSLGLTYKLNREVWLKGEYRRDWLRSNEHAADYTADIFTVGMRLQR